MYGKQQQNVTVNDLKTVGGMQSYLSQQPSVGLATTMNEAIIFVRQTEELPPNAPLTRQVLETIRQAIYATNDPSRGNVDPVMMLFNALLSSTGNAAEEALQFIGKLQASIK